MVWPDSGENKSTELVDKGLATDVRNFAAKRLSCRKLSRSTDASFKRDPIGVPTRFLVALINVHLMNFSRRAMECGGFMPKKPQWNEIPCPECREPVSSEASRCPHCQAVYSDTTIEGRKKQQNASNKIGCGCVAVLGFLLLAFCVGVSGDPKDKEAPEAAASTESGTMPKAGSATPQITEAMVRFQNEIMDSMAPCDAAGKSLAAQADGLRTGRASVYDA